MKNDLFSGTPARLSGALVMLLALFFPPFAPAQDQEAGQEEVAATIAEMTEGMVKYSGFFTFYWDEKEGRIWLEIDNWGEEFIYINSLPAGIGSNDIGLDRGQLGGTRMVFFEQVGPKVLMVQPNYEYRAVSDDPFERAAVEQSFARSIIWGFTSAAEEDGKVLVDATDFLLRDAHNVAGRLKRSNQGNYALDTSRSAVYLPRTRNFPKNSEMEVTLTFAGEPEGGWIRSVTPSPDAVTVRQHHSFVEAPDDGYRTRRYDPRSSFSDIEYMDYSTPFDQPIEQRFTVRHRLRKKNPEARISDPVEPIVYYVDRGAPEPIKSALIEGASWWNEAFEAAGYRNAFRVEVLPEDADSLDVRYNMIQWVHRSTRGWSYGGSVVDPRTGEIIKGHVTLGSLRVRQDYLIAVALSAPYTDGNDTATAAREMALARIRQLSAHEVGHTLGLRHNYASSFNERASVMDYPHPLVKLDWQGRIDLSDAYDTGIGEWDEVSIAYGYQDFPAGTDEKAALEGILAQARARGLLFISDSDARPRGGAHPLAHLWDNGTDAAAELDRVLGVRRVALANFSENNIRQGEPVATLEDVLVPLYLFHRYQLEAAVKLIAGLNYSYTLRGDGGLTTDMIDGATQRRALQSILMTIHPDTLTLPERIIRLIPPQVPGYSRSRESFRTRTGRTFDPLAAGETAAGMTVSLLLHPERATRLVEYHARDNSLPGLEEVLDALIDATWKERYEPGLKTGMAGTAAWVALRGMMLLAIDDAASEQARAITLYRLSLLMNWCLEELESTNNDARRARLFSAAKAIEAFLEEPEPENIPRPLTPPDGSPIGQSDAEDIQEIP